MEKTIKKAFLQIATFTFLFNHSHLHLINLMIIKKDKSEIENFLVDAANYRGNCNAVYFPENELEIIEIMFDAENHGTIIVNTIMKQIPASVSSSEKMQSVMNKFQITQAWNLPVIDDGKYVGFLSKSRIFNTYRTHLIRHTKE